MSVRNGRKNEGESFDDDDDNDDFRNVNADSSERTEIKNLNSLRSIRNAIKYEKERHGRYFRRHRRSGKSRTRNAVMGRKIEQNDRFTIERIFVRLPIHERTRRFTDCANR